MKKTSSHNNVSGKVAAQRFAPDSGTAERIKIPERSA
jgi:hypothetical protein